MYLFRRVSLASLRNFSAGTSVPKAAQSSESWWADGKMERVPGYLFNETPPPPGQSRKRESWELGWYAMLGALGLFVFVGYPARPDTSLTHWARKQAIKELREEGVEV